MRFNPEESALFSGRESALLRTKLMSAIQVTGLSIRETADVLREVARITEAPCKLQRLETLRNIAAKYADKPNHCVHVRLRELEEELDSP